MSSVLAIDFGNENLVISAPRKGGVDVINNQSSQRLTPSMVAFSETRRYAGEFARQQQMQNVKGTITNLKRLVGLKYDSNDREVVQKLIPFKLVKLDDGYIGVEVMYLNELNTFRVEQCIALLLKEVFQIANHQNIHASDCVIVISPWWDECQRRSILDSAKIAGFNVLKLLNSTTAAAIVYSMYHRKKLPESADKAVPVAFVDFGDSTLNVAIVSLSQGTVEVKGFACDEHLGGIDFTSALVKMLLEKTKQKYKIDPTQNPRAMLRFTQAAEKLKKSLSINPVMPFDVQSCMNDIDISFMVKREEYEETITGLVERIESPIVKALELADVKKEDLFAIEVHGGASRVKAVKDKIRSVFGKDLTQSLNPDECFSMGAGFQAAILSPQYRVDLKVKDVAPHQVMIEWVDDQGVKKTNELFKQFNVVPCTKIVPIKVKRNCHVRLFNEQTGEIGYTDIDTGSDEVLTVRLKVRLTPNGIIEVIEATHQITEEIIIPEEPKKEEPKKEEAKKEEPKKEDEKKEEEPKKEGEQPKPEEATKEEPKKEGEEPKVETANDTIPPTNSEEQLFHTKSEEQLDKKAEEDKKEQPKESEPEKPAEPKKKIIKKDIPVAFHFKAHYGLSNDLIEKYKAEERKMFKRDQDEIKIDNARNELESYIFTMNTYITRDYPEYFDPSKKDEYLQKTSQAQCWFEENEFDRLPLKDYEDQVAILKKFGEPAIARRNSRIEVPRQIQEFIDQAETEKKKLDNKDEKFSHITEEERSVVRKDIEAYVAWLNSQLAEVEKTPKHLDVPFKRGEAQNKFYAVEKKVKDLLMKPKPAPPKKEEKKEENKDEKKEENKDEKKEEAKDEKKEENKDEKKEENKEEKKEQPEADGHKPEDDID